MGCGAKDREDASLDLTVALQHIERGHEDEGAQRGNAGLAQPTAGAPSAGLTHQAFALLCIRPQTVGSPGNPGIAGCPRDGA